jgi:multiple sugar transport system permease protein
MSASPAVHIERAYNPFTWSKRTRRNFRLGMLFLSPWLIGFVVFTLYPMVASLIYSFNDFSFHQALRWVGLKNYIALFQDKYFWIALANTAYMVIIGVPLILMFSFSCAVLLNIKVPGQSIYRVIFYIPAIVPTIASTLLWIWVLNPQSGLLNTALGYVGIDGPNWLRDPNWSKPALLMLALWGTGNTMIIYLSGLQDVPVHLLEAAELDGANWWQRMRHVTVPMVSPITVYNLIIGMIVMFQYFAQAYVFSRVSSANYAGTSPVGQPLNSTLFYSIYLYQNGFQFLKMGYASAMAWILFLVILACTVLSLRVSERYTYYSG